MNVISAYECILDTIFGNRTYNENHWIMKDDSFKSICNEYTKNIFIEKGKTQRPVDAKTREMLEILFKNALDNGYKIKGSSAIIHSLVEYLKKTCSFNAQALRISGIDEKKEECRKRTALLLFRCVLIQLEGKGCDKDAFDDDFIYILQEYLNRYTFVNDSPVKISDQYNHIHPVSGKYYCPRDYIIKQIDNLFKYNNLIFIVGVSGSGKSELCRYYGEIKQQEKGINKVIPIRLLEDGSGDINSLSSQIMHSHSSLPIIGFNSFSLITDKDLIILDNFNDLNNSVIHQLIDFVPNVKIIVSTQSYSDDLSAIGGVIHLERIEKENVGQHSIFSANVFCKYGGIDYTSISKSDKSCIDRLMELIGYHTMVSAMLGRQFMNLGQNLNSFLGKVSKSVEEAIGINLKVSMIKDNEKYNLSPHDLVKHLFKNKLFPGRFSEIERQVLGAIILCEGYSSNQGLICSLIGDSENDNLYHAKTNLQELHSQGIITVENENVYIHPLIKTLICDSSYTDKTNNTLAELSYDFQIHLIKNKLVEKYSIFHPESISALFNRPQGWHSWVLDATERIIIPHLIVEIPWLNDALKSENYYYAYCRCSTGSSIYLHWDTGIELCILNANYQESAEYRYFDAKRDTPSNTEFKYSILIKYVGTALPNYTLPETIANSPVTKISSSLFRGNKTIENVVLPNLLSRIPDYAFCDCINLRSIVIPNSVTSIGTRAFYNCNQLTDIDLSKNLKYISIAAFAYCMSLKGDLILPDGLYDIHKYAFAHCLHITRVVLPDSLDDIGEYVFDECTSLSEVNLGKHLFRLPVGIFHECHSLKTMHIPASVKIIDEDAFNNCKNLSEVTMDEGIETIRGHAFYYCNELKLVQLPASLTFIDRFAVKNCPKAYLEISHDSLAEQYIFRYITEMNIPYKYRYRSDGR